MNLIKYLRVRLVNEYYRLFIYPRVKKDVKDLHVKTINYTIKSLIHSKKSLSRIGDGEMRRIIGCENLYYQQADKFEKNSKLLRNKLINVINSNNKNLEIGLPNIFSNLSDCNSRSKRFCKLLLAKYGKRFIKYLNFDKEYYNSEFSRFYIGGKSRLLSSKRFNLLKQIWNNKNLLIIEGNKCRVGLNNELFSNAKSIRRIECPSINAFESYQDILNHALNFLINRKHILSLIALGPSATVMASDLADRGYRAIDIGQVDIEYEWYLNKTKKRINLPDRYVSEVINGENVTPVKNKRFLSEIIYNIK